MLNPLSLFTFIGPKMLNSAQLGPSFWLWDLELDDERWRNIDDFSFRRWMYHSCDTEADQPVAPPWCGTAQGHGTGEMALARRM